VSCLDKDQLIYGDFECINMDDPTTPQVVLSYCNLNDNTPNYTNWAGITTSGGQRALSDNDISMLESKLNAILIPQNQSAVTDKKVACVLAITNSNSQTVNPNVNVVTSFSAQFITSGGTVTTHQISLTVDMNFNRTITLDGNQI
jgi:hypothetical protein